MPQRQDEAASVTEAAWRLLAYRARTRSELRARLARRGFTAESIEAVLDRLAELGYLDDGAFARALVAARQTGAGARGPAALRAELRRKGVAAETAEEAIAKTDAATAAREAARKGARALAALEWQPFRRRLLGFLQRRGFDYDAANAAVRAAWLQSRGTAPPGVDEEAFDPIPDNPESQLH